LLDFMYLIENGDEFEKFFTTSKVLSSDASSQTIHSILGKS